MTQPRQPQPADLFSGVFIPRAVLEDGRLTGPARILYGSLDGLARSERGCFAGSAYLARIVGVKPRQLRNLLQTLERCGYITRTLLPKGGRIIRTVGTMAFQTVKRGAAIDCQGVRQQIATDIIRDTDNPPSPLKRGTRVRVKKVKLNKEDYTRGF